MSDDMSKGRQSVLYALDFDGVICDSAVELALSAWQVARQLWDDMPEACAPAHIEAYCLVRPIIETGYESIPIMRLLHQGYTAQVIIDDYAALMATTIEDAGQSIDVLKARFGAYRDQWIRDDEQGWLANNLLFPGISDKMSTLENQTWYIITTKQERFAQRVLEANGIQIPAERIFGLDRRMSKQAVLLQLQEAHDLPMVFVEDRLPTLLGVQQNPALSAVQLQLVDWGYNTAADREQAKAVGIPVISVDGFLSH